MSELTLLLLRIGFLILMWAFVFSIVYALRSDLFGTKVRRLPAAGASASVDPSASFATPAAAVPAPTSPVAAPDPDAPARRLVITSGAKEGHHRPRLHERHLPQGPQGHPPDAGAAQHPGEHRHDDLRAAAVGP